MYGGVHYVIHSDGLRVAGRVAYVGRFVYIFEFSTFEDVRLRACGKPSRRSRREALFSRRGVMITLRRRVPLSLSGGMLIGSWSRRVYVSHKEPEVFLKELDCAWNRWRLTHCERQTDPKSGSSTFASPPAFTTSTAA